VDAELSIALVSQETSAGSIYPVYFLCEAELRLPGCDRGGVPIRALLEQALLPRLGVRGNAAVTAYLDFSREAERLTQGQPPDAIDPGSRDVAAPGEAKGCGRPLVPERLQGQDAGTDGRNSDATSHRTPRASLVINKSSRSANRSFLRGIDAGGRRAAMPRLSRVVLSAAHVSRSDQAALPAAAALGTEHAHQNDRSLPAVRSGVDVALSQERGAVRGSARPALSFVFETIEAPAC